MDLELKYKKAKNKSEAFQIVKANVTPKTLESFKVKADISYYEESDQIVADGKGFTLRTNFYDDRAEADLELSFLLKPAKGKILAQIEKMFSRIL